MNTIEVKAKQGLRVPTPYGMIWDQLAVEVPLDLFIRRRLAEGDLILASAKKVKRRSASNRASKKRRTD